MTKGFVLTITALVLYCARLSPPVHAQNEEALRLRSQIEQSLKKNEFRKALAAAEEYAKKHPRDYMAYQFKARALYELSNIGGARKYAEKAVALNREDFYSLYLLGKIHMKKGDPGGGLSLFNQALTINPDFPEGHLGAGEAYLKTGKHDRARKEFRLAREAAITPDEKIWTFIGGCYMEAGLPMDAVSVYREFLQEHPDNPRIHYLTGLAFLKKGDGRAEGAFKKAVLYGPGNATFREAYADALIKAKKVKDAIEQYEKAHATGKATYITYFRLGIIYFQQGKTNEAVTFLERALKSRPDLVNAHLALSSMYLKSGRYRECAEHCKAIIALEKNNDTAYYNMACALAKLGKKEEALNAITLAVKLLPENKKLAAEEKMLESLRSMPAFQKLTR